jgi:Prealbumin-like fold domain
MNRTRKRTVALVAAGGLVAAGLVAATSAQADSPSNIGNYLIQAAANKAAMLDTSPAPTNLPDPEGNAKELGPVNSNTTKLVVIHDAAVPMLDFTNPNAQVDLRDIWLGTSTGGSGGAPDDQYLYFAWERDSSNGSGVLMIEFQKTALGAECNYTDAGFDPNLCNPWAGRQAGDFILVWDQQGQTIKIIKRTFFDDNGVLALDAGVELQTAKAATSTDGFFGEAAINLTQDVFNSGANSCTTLANVIPGTVTGNSDTADYKDTVLAQAPPISNCGSVTVKKVTDPAGDTDTSFTWTLDRADGADINFTPASSASDTIKDGQTDTVSDLIAGTNYNLAETDPGPKYAIDSIVCTDADGTEYDVTGGGDFPVVAGETTACVITNTLQPGKLIVTKTVVNNDGGAKVATDFEFSVDGGSAANFLQDGADTLAGKNTIDPIDPGDHTVSETEVPGYTTTYGGDCDASGNVTVPAGGEATCAITNDDQPGKLIVTKTVINDNGDSRIATDFKFSLDGGSDVSFIQDGANTLAGKNTIDPIDAGSHTVVENDTLGYSVTYGGDCDASGNVTVVNGQTSTCTVTNDDAAGSTTVLTTQSRILRDSAEVTMRTGGGASTVTFSVFDSVAACEAYKADPENNSPLWSTTDDVTEGAGSGSADTYGAENGGYLATSPGSYFWLAEFSGNNFNEANDSGCGTEITVVNFTDDGTLPQ